MENTSILAVITVKDAIVIVFNVLDQNIQIAICLD